MLCVGGAGARPHDGELTLYQVLKLHFPQDLRAKEVRRLLQSAEPVRIAIQQRPEVRYADMHVHACIMHVPCLQ